MELPRLSVGTKRYYETKTDKVEVLKKTRERDQKRPKNEATVVTITTELRIRDVKAHTFVSALWYSDTEGRASG